MAKPTMTSPTMTHFNAALVDTPSPFVSSCSPGELFGPAVSSSGTAVDGGMVGTVVELATDEEGDADERRVVDLGAAVVRGRLAGGLVVCVGDGRDERVVDGSWSSVVGVEVD